MSNAHPSDDYRNDPTGKTARIELRSTERQKQLLEQAAATYGESLTGFVLASAIERAIQIIHDATVTEISLQDMERFAQIIESDIKPNKNLKAAATKHRKLVRSDV